MCRFCWRLGLLMALVIAALASRDVGLAAAQYTPAALVSYSGSLEADDAYSPAISGDGEYVVFVGSFDGVHGVYRKNLASGELALVAGEDSADPALSAPDASAPSISEEGRYVSFTTTARLDPVDDQDGDPGHCSSVYVRDMNVLASQPGSYTLVSALDGSNQGITYAGDASSGCPGGGAAAADRVAISGNGEEVAFTVLGPSDLTSGSDSVTTPPDQVALRNLRTNATTLVSQTTSSLGGTPEAVPGGAALAPPSGDLQSGDGRQISGSTAAISADGSTVAWMGVDIAAQAPAAAAEDSSAKYDEPLWRRIAEGPQAPIRRVTGGDDPQCACQGPLDTAYDPNASGGAIGPEHGAYVDPGGFGGDPLQGGSSLDSVTPQLSANGQIVAILSTQPRSGEVSRALEEELTTSSANAYVVNMASGLTRSAALTQLTAWGTSDFKDLASTGPVQEIALSPSGEQVAFTTARIDFPLTPPVLLTPELSQPGSTQLYVANLGAGSLEMVSYGFEGEPANGNIVTPSFTRNGETLAFASSASNLVYGAYDRGAQGLPGNVFVTSQVSVPVVAAETSLTAPPSDPVALQRWELLLEAKSMTNGSVELYATVPGPGVLKASAQAGVPVAHIAKHAKASKRRGKIDTRRTRRPSRADAARSKQPSGTRLADRVVASATSRPSKAGLVHLHLTLPPADRTLARRQGGLYATIAVSFAAKGKSTLKGTVQASFRRGAPKRSSKATKKR